MTQIRFFDRRKILAFTAASFYILCSISYKINPLGVHVYIRYEKYVCSTKIKFNKNLKMEKSEIRAYILIRNNLQIDAPTIHSELVASFGNSAPSLVTVYRWVARFNFGQESTRDMPRVGRPITESTFANIKLVEAIIRENPRISFTMRDWNHSFHVA